MMISQSQFRIIFFRERRSRLIMALRRPYRAVYLQLGNIGNYYSNERDLHHESPRPYSPSFRNWKDTHFSYIHTQNCFEL